MNLIKQAWKKIVGMDDKTYPQETFQTSSDFGKYIRSGIYGICSVSPLNSHVLLLKTARGVNFGIENDYINRLKTLKEGEVALYNTKTSSTILLKEDGSIEIITDSGLKINADVEIVGDVTIDGEVTTTGQVEATEFFDGTTHYTLHKHVDPQGGTTGTPIE